MLQSHVKDYKTYLTYLTEADVIVSDNWYKKGKNALATSLRPFIQERLRGIEI